MSNEELNLKITMYPDDQASLRTLGALPYMLVEVDRGEGGDLEMTVETGGGVPQEDVALDHLLELMKMALGHGEEV